MKIKRIFSGLLLTSMLVAAISAPASAHHGGGHRHGEYCQYGADCSYYSTGYYHRGGCHR